VAGARLRDELAEPWGIVAAGLLGGLGWAVGLPALAAAGVAAAVYGVKVGTGLLSGRAEPPGDDGRTPRPLPPPPKGSPGDLLLRRADAAVADIQRLSRTPGNPWLRDQIDRVDEDAGETLDSVRRVAGRLAMVEGALARIDVGALQARRAGLSAAAASVADPGLRAEQQRGVAAVDQQLAAYGRLVTARDTLGTRLETTVLGLEGLVTGLHEVIAAGEGLTDHAGVSGRSVQAIAADLDALRQGLSEVEALDWPEPPGAGPA
jgi:hypothetical protein